MTIRMISLKPHLYAAKRLAVGAEFEASGETHARLLVALGRAARAELKQEVAQTPATAPVVEAPVVAPAVKTPRRRAIDQEGEPEAVKPKRTYRRRDMTVGDE